MKKTLLTSLLAAVCVGTLAAQTVYEGFNYSGTNFNGGTGGSGFTGAWSITGGTPDIVAGYQASSLDITNNPFSPIGGAAVSYNNAGNAVRTLTSTINLGADSAPVYFSYLIQVEDITVENQISFYAGTTAVLDTGIRSSQFRLRSGQSSQVLGGTPVNNTTYLIAGFIDPNASGNDVFGLNVYTNGSAIPTSVSTSTSGDWLLYDNGKSLSSVINILAIQASGLTDTTQGRFDEFRMGTSWAAVTVPEPGTYALLAGCLALASVMVRRRRS